MLNAVFNDEAAVKPAIYDGPEGYRRMIGEIRQSLYDQVPGARGNIEIFDQSNPDRRAEYERVARSLGTTFEAMEAAHKSEFNGSLLAAKYEHGGIAIAFPVGDRTVSIAYGADLNDQYTDDEIRSEGRRVVHEVFHGIDMALLKIDTTILGDPAAYTASVRGIENFAEMGSTDLLTRNGQQNMIVDLAATYQAGLGIRDDNVYRHGEPQGSYDIDHPQADFYDHADGYRMLQKMHAADPAPPPQLMNFELTGWQSSIDRAQQVRSQMQNMSMDSVNIDRAQNLALGQVRNYFITLAERDIGPHKEEIEKRYGDTRHYTEYLFNHSSEKTFAFNEVGGGEAEAASGIFQRQGQWLDWLRDRSFIPNADRIVNGYDLRDGRTADVTGSDPAEASRPDQLMGQAALQWIKTKDPLDRFAFIEFARAADVETDMLFDGKGSKSLRTESQLSRLGFAEGTTLDSLIGDKDKMQRLANGETYDTVYKTGGFDVNEDNRQEWLKQYNTSPASPAR